ncbi:hypothetical protein CDL12_26228 [Handroanthus impetiginosus]|uniref:Uncharacterized protein n=1 Tax=Handroanthus impetiginosus TaxID=429701 RepID=A0A2G9G7J0_9LAMI|nr:hypothetical protein CDL12_26228 [Handroanthus impetiginosus]
MSSAWTNMSFAIIRRDVEWEWENSGWSLWYIYIIGSSCSLSEELSSGKI